MNLELLKKDIITKTDIQNVVENVIQEIDAGTMNPLEVITRSKALEEIAKGLKTNVQSMAETEFDKYGKDETVSFNGIEISFASRSAGLNYDEDPEHKLLNEKTKERKKLLDDSFKQNQKGNELVVNGEQIPVVTSKGNGSSYFKFKIK